MLTSVPAVCAVARRPHPLRHALINRRALARSAASAAFGQAINHPHEWGRGFPGFARRFGSSLAQHGVKNVIQFEVGSLRHEYLGYQRSRRKGFGPRMKYVFANTFLARRAGHRKRSLATGRLAGAFGSGLISRLWQPARLHTFGSGMESGGISLGVDLATNTAREFGPDLRHRLRRQRR